MRRAILWWGLVCWSLQVAAFATALDHGAGAGRPFVQRIALTDYLLLETNSDLALSPSQQLVVAFTTKGRFNVVERAMALRRKAPDVYVLSYLVAQPTIAANRYHREELQLDPEISRNVLACFRHLLEQKALSVQGALYQSSEDDDAWIFLRPEANKAIAGVALNHELHGNGGAAIYRDLCAGLFVMFVVTEERSTVLKQLDRLTAVYIKTNRLDRR